MNKLWKEYISKLIKKLCSLSHIKQCLTCDPRFWGKLPKWKRYASFFNSFKIFIFLFEPQHLLWQKKLWSGCVAPFPKILRVLFYQLRQTKTQDKKQDVSFPRVPSSGNRYVWAGVCVCVFERMVISVPFVFAHNSFPKEKRPALGHSWRTAHSDGVFCSSRLWAVCEWLD